MDKFLTFPGLLLPLYRRRPAGSPHRRGAVHREDRSRLRGEDVPRGADSFAARLLPPWGRRRPWRMPRVPGQWTTAVDRFALDAGPRSGSFR